MEFKGLDDFHKQISLQGFVKSRSRMKVPDARGNMVPGTWTADGENTRETLNKHWCVCVWERLIDWLTASGVHGNTHYTTRTCWMYSIGIELWPADCATDPCTADITQYKAAVFKLFWLRTPILLSHSWRTPTLVTVTFTAKYSNSWAHCFLQTNQHQTSTLTARGSKFMT